MSAINLDKVVEIKNLMNDKFGLYMHMHDNCEMQYFNFDEVPKAEVWDAIRECVKPLSMDIEIFKDDMSFKFIRLDSQGNEVKYEGYKRY